MTRTKPAEDINSFVDLSHIRRMSAPPPPAQPDLPFPQRDRAQIIEGPRVRLRYGSAATEVDMAALEWRRTDGLPEHEYHFQNRWRSIHNWRDTDCIVGKRVQLLGTDYIGIAEEDDEGFLQFADEDDGTFHTCLQAEDLTILQDDVNLNPFEAAIAAHKEKSHG